jgi:hypothetical protein
VGTRRRLERLEERLVAQTASPDGEAWGELLKRLTTDDTKLCTRMSSVSLYFFLGTYLCTCF